jgi:hypothetical protein
MHQTAVSTYTSVAPTPHKATTHISAWCDDQPVDTVESPVLIDHELKDSLLRARLYFIFCVVFDVVMVAVNCVQFWSITHEDAELRHFLLGDHLDTSTGTQIGVIFSAMCFACDAFLGVMLVLLIDACISSGGDDWASLRCSAVLNWYSNLLTLVLWTILRLHMFKHASFVHFFGLCMVLLVRLAKLRPMKAFKDGIIGIDDDGDQRALVAAWPAPQNNKALWRLTQCCVGLLILLALFLVASVAKENMQDRDGYGTTTSGETVLAPTTLYAQGREDDFGNATAMPLSKLQAPITHFLSTSPPSEHPTIASEMTTLYSQDSSAAPQRMLSHFASLNQGEYRWYCNDRQCGGNCIAKHRITHKGGLAALAAGSSAATAAMACSRMGFAAEGPLGAVGGAAVCGLGGAVVGGAGTLLEETEDDMCIDECDPEVPKYVFDTLYCIEGSFSSRCR